MFVYACDFNIIIYCNNKSIHCLTAYHVFNKIKILVELGFVLYTFLRMRLFVLRDFLNFQLSIYVLHGLR